MTRGTFLSEATFLDNSSSRWLFCCSMTLLCEDIFGYSHSPKIPVVPRRLERLEESSEILELKLYSHIRNHTLQWVAAHIWGKSANRQNYSEKCYTQRGITAILQIFCRFDGPSFLIGTEFATTDFGAGKTAKPQRHLHFRHVHRPSLIINI